MPNKNKGLFITVEGVEGVGKSTNINFIQQYLRDKKIDFISTREPGGTELAEQIRHLLLAQCSETVHPMTELLLIFASRNQHLEEVIKPALANGQWVLCDRFTDATYAYQGAGRNIDCNSISVLENLVQEQLRPDLTMLLDAPVALGLQRAAKRGELDRFEQEEIAFFERVRANYLHRAESNVERFAVIDARGELSDVQKQISQVLDHALNYEST